MSDRTYFTLASLSAAALICLALVWPQGLGARSLGPFGSVPIQQTPAMQAALARDAARASARQRARISAAAVRLRRLSGTGWTGPRPQDPSQSGAAGAP